MQQKTTVNNLLVLKEGYDLAIASLKPSKPLSISINHGIQFDGETVWIYLSTGETIARFSRFGIDIHTTIEEQLQDNRPQCLNCFHGKTTLEHWKEFQDKMLSIYQIEISDKYKPSFI